MSSPVRLSRGLLHEVALPGVLVDDVREALLEALLVHAAFAGRDAVRVGVDALVVARVPLQSDLDLLVRLGLDEGGDLAEERFLRGVQVPDEVDDAAGVAVGLLGLRARGARP